MAGNGLIGFAQLNHRSFNPKSSVSGIILGMGVGENKLRWRQQWKREDCFFSNLQILPNRPGATLTVPKSGST